MRPSRAPAPVVSVPRADVIEPRSWRFENRRGPREPRKRCTCLRTNGSACLCARVLARTSTTFACFHILYVFRLSCRSRSWFRTVLSGVWPSGDEALWRRCPPRFVPRPHRTTFPENAQVYHMCTPSGFYRIVACPASLTVRDPGTLLRFVKTGKLSPRRHS